MRLPWFVCMWPVVCASVFASSFDNEAAVYQLTGLPDPQSEARRMDRMMLSDQQPAGRFARRGEILTIHTEGLRAGDQAFVVLGFLPMWNVSQTQQVQALKAGAVRFRANQDGPVFFRFNPQRGRGADDRLIEISMDGGEPLPLYVDKEMDAEDWAAELEAHSAAPFVQLLSEHAMITLPAKVHARNPVDDPEQSFEVIESMIRMQNEVAGFDGSSPRDQPTALRLHYLVDFRVSAADRENFYMYATDQFIGMLDHNTTDLTDPDRLREQWGIWHETGHTHQQHSWTFDALVEVNVNLYSLYVQEQFGQPNLLGASEDGAPSFFEQAREMLDGGAPDFLAEVPEDDDRGLFIKLVMFHQLKEGYGWELFQDLHKHFRAQPLSEDASDQDKADALVETLCLLTGTDLRGFFGRWGLAASAAADARIEEAAYALPDHDLSVIFE